MADLKAAGPIQYHRGGMRILDRAGLEAASCECYGIVRVGQRRPVVEARGASEAEALRDHVEAPRPATRP